MSILSMSRRQRGFTGKGLVWFLIIGGFILWIFFKLFPIYTENLKIGNALENLKTQPEIAKRGNGEIKSMLLKRLGVDGITRLTDLNFDEYVVISRQEGKLSVTAAFNSEVLLFKDLYLLVKFDKTIEVSQ